MLEPLGLAVSAGVAHVATNLDNLALLVGLILTLGSLRPTGGYVVSQILVIGAAYLVSEGLESELPRHVGYLGFIPIGLGIYALIQRVSGKAQTSGEETQKAHFLAVVLLFLSVSFDSFAVLTPLLADSKEAYSFAIVFGASLSAVLLAGLGVFLAKLAPRRAGQLGRLEWFAPYVMIAIGTYVVINTGTDIT